MKNLNKYYSSLFLILLITILTCGVISAADTTDINTTNSIADQSADSVIETNSIDNLVQDNSVSSIDSTSSKQEITNNEQFNVVSEDNEVQSEIEQKNIKKATQNDVKSADALEINIAAGARVTYDSNIGAYVTTSSGMNIYAWSSTQPSGWFTYFNLYINGDPEPVGSVQASYYMSNYDYVRFNPGLNVITADWTGGESTSNKYVIFYDDGTRNVATSISISSSSYQINYGDSIKIYTPVEPDGVGGVINLYIDGDNAASYSVASMYDSETGEMKTGGTITPPKAGNITFQAKFVKNDYYKASESNIITVEVLPIDTEITANPVEIEEGETAVLNVKLNDVQGNVVSNQKVTITINGKSYTESTNNQGIATFQIPGLTADEYDVDIVYAGGEWQNRKYSELFAVDSNGNINWNYPDEDYQHAASTGSTTVKVTSSVVYMDTKLEITDLDTNKYVNEEHSVTVKLTDADGNPIANQDVTFNLNSQTVTTDNSGFAKFSYNFPSNGFGTKDFKISYSGNDSTGLDIIYTAAADVTDKFISISYPTNVTIELLNNTYGNVIIKGEVYNNTDNKNKLTSQGFIVLYVDDEIVTDGRLANGGYTFTVADLAVGQHTAYVHYERNTIYNVNNSETITFEVVEDKPTGIPTTITVYAADIKATQDVNISGKLTAEDNSVDLTDMTIIITINGTQYEAYTDAEGNFEFNDITIDQYATGVPVTAIFESVDDLDQSNEATTTFNVDLIPVYLKTEGEYETVVNNSIYIPFELYDSLEGDIPPFQGEVHVYDQNGTEIQSFMNLDVDTPRIVAPAGKDGEFTYTIIYSDSGLVYASNQTTVKYTVKPLTPTLTLNAENIYAGQYVDISGTLNIDGNNVELGEKTISLTINGTEYTTETEEDGSFVFNGVQFNSEATSIPVTAIFNKVDGITESNLEEKTFNVLIIPVDLSATPEVTTTVNKSVEIPIDIKDTVNNGIPLQGKITVLNESGNEIDTYNFDVDHFEFIPDVENDGEFEYTIVYSDKGRMYEENSVKVKVIVNPIQTTITVTAKDIYAGENVSIEGTLSSEEDIDLSDKEISLTINGTKYTTTTDDEGNFKFTDLVINTQATDVPVTAKFNKINGLTESNEATDNFNVKLIPVDVSADEEFNTIVNENVEIPITLVDTINGGIPTKGTITITKDGKEFATINVDETLEFTHIASESGEFTYVITYTDEANKYDTDSTTVKVVVEKLPTVISAENVTTDYGVDATVTIDLKDTKNDVLPSEGTVTVLDENNKVVATIDVATGALEFTHEAVKDGDYTYTIKYSANKNYVGSETTVKVTVNKLPTKTTAQDQSTNYGEDVTVIINVVDTVNDKLPSEGTVVVTDVDGKVVATLDIKDALEFTHIADEAGEFTYTISYSATNNYVESSTTVTVTVEQLATEISAADVTTDYGVDATVTIDLKDTVNDVVPTQGIVTVTDVDGKVVATIDVAKDDLVFTHEAVHDGEFVYTLTFTDSANKYVGSTGSVKVTVNKLPTAISAADVTTDYGVDATVTIDLKDTVNNVLPKEGIVTVLDENGETVVTLSVDDELVFTHAAVKDGDYTYTIKYSADKNYVGSESTVKVTVNKLPTKTTAQDQSTNYGEDVTVIINVVDTVNDKLPSEGTVVVTDVDGKVVATLDIKDALEFTHAADEAGEFTYTISYSATNNYVESSTTVTVTVEKLPTAISAENVTTDYGVDATVTIDLKDTVNNVLPKEGIVTVLDENGETVVTLSVDDALEFTHAAVKDGEFTYTIKYDAENNYIASETTVKVTVNKLPTEISAENVTTKFGVDTTVTINLKDTKNDVLPNEGTVTVTDSDGKVVATLYVNDDLVFTHIADEPGEFVYTISYSAINNYVESSTTVKVTVETKEVILKFVEVTDTVIDKNNKVSVELTCGDEKVSGEKVTIIIDGKSYKVTTDENGIATVEKFVSKKLRNDVPVSASYAGNNATGYSEAETIEDTFNVRKINTIITIDDIDNVTYKDSVIITGKFIDEFDNLLGNSNVVLNINGISYDVQTDNEGVYTLTIKALTIGQNDVKPSYGGNYKYNPSENSTTFNVAKKDTNIVIDDIETKYYKDNVTITGKFTNADGEALINSNVIVTVNGVSKTVKTDKQGIFTFTTKATTVGTNDISVSYKGNAKYNPTEATATFDVIKKDTAITIDDISSKVYGDDVIVTGKFTNADGEALIRSNVVVTVNGVSKTVKTDDEGVFTFTTKANKAGTNNVTVSYKGNAKYNAAEASTTFETAKKSTKLSLSAVNTKVNQATTIDVTLTDEDNQPISDKVNLTINNETKEYDIKKVNSPLTTLQ